MTAEAVDRLGAGRDVERVSRPDDVHTTLHELATFDGARVMGVLHERPGARSVIALAHPRQSLAHHPMIDWFLRMGLSVWTQDTRSPNNDIALVHEQAILDVAAGQVFLRDHGYETVLTFGHSGGGTLMAFYIEQAALPPAQRIDVTPAGRPVPLPAAPMPVPDGALFLAPHPGQGRVLLNCIDPSVADESDPLSVIPELNMYDPANGFAEPPASSSYSADFVAEYRAAQERRIRRIDALADELAAEASAARARHAETRDPRDRRVALAPRIITTYRTDADPRYTDLSLDPGDRPYGSLFGRRPDLTNYGLVGFGRLTTPDSWLSTWSAFRSNAIFERCAPGIHIPTIYVDFSGDQAAPTPDATRMFAAIATPHKLHATVPGHHFGQPLTPTHPPGYTLAAQTFHPWLTTHYPLAP
ncbi:hypothetical protein [Actinocorallia sp. A-T 12471]|uniref:hypothetical protein n=1 Tax=Actinocorallia sp. A-T 12471 TaxID=3089813 RepID=UPI0029D2AF15|nr:hypothetical protein [Actinocorallia sp. A-T 12471]MDX6741688.1 hypothetical protein [Actinocorallia sp. A-T 12471]